MMEDSNTMKVSRSRKRWCFVPLCANTSINNPEKLFVTVPINLQRKKQWFIAARRELKDVSIKTHFYCCEDHFKLEEDMENYLEYRLAKVKIRMRPEVVPHIFTCQSDKQIGDSPQSSEKRAIKRKVSDILQETPDSENIPNDPDPEPGHKRDLFFTDKSCMDPNMTSVLPHYDDTNTDPVGNEAILIKEETSFNQEIISDEISTDDRCLSPTHGHGVELASTSMWSQNNAGNLDPANNDVSNFVFKEENNLEKLIKEETLDYDLYATYDSDLKEMHWTSNFHGRSEEQGENYNGNIEPEGNVEPSPVESVLPKKHRIVDLQHLLNWSLKMQQNHSESCPSGQMTVVEELQMGLISAITFECNECRVRQVFCTEDPQLTTSDLNVRAVRGMLSTGLTYDRLQKFLSGLDVPCMSRELFETYEMELKLWNYMAETGREERAWAMRNGQLGDDGVPWVEVFLEGGWNKRFCGADVNASGVSAIIGRHTQKLLFLGVHNKYCTVCAREASLQTESTTNHHKCLKSWHGTQRATEQDIIIEGFNSSQTMHKLKYRRYVADGAQVSALTDKITQEVTYGAEVEQISCYNEAARYLGQSLVDAAKNGQGIAKELLSDERIVQMQDFLMKLIILHADGEVEGLKKDTETFVKHVYGHHSKCRETYCEHVGKTHGRLMGQVVTYGLHFLINGVLKKLLTNGPQIIDEETRNRVALYKSILDFNAGKELLLSGRSSLQAKSGNNGRWCDSSPESGPAQWKNVIAADEECTIESENSLDSDKKPSVVKQEITSTIISYSRMDWGVNLEQASSSGGQITSEGKRQLNDPRVEDALGTNSQKKAAKVSSTTAERKKSLIMPKSRGNLCLLNEKKIVRPVRRPVRTKRRLGINKRDYAVCEHCLVEIKRSYMPRHRKYCQLSNDEGQPEGETLSVDAISESDVSNENDLVEVFDEMKKDDVTMAARGDPMIRLYGNVLVTKHNTKHLHQLVSRKMRKLARLLIILRKSKTVDTFLDALQPEMYTHILDATRALAGYDENARSFNSPSVVAEMRTDLKYVCVVAKKAIALKDPSLGQITNYEEKKADVSKLYEMISLQWWNDLGALAYRALNPDFMGNQEWENQTDTEQQKPDLCGEAKQRKRNIITGRVKWKFHQKQTVLEGFAMHIENGMAPKKRECLDFIKAHPEFHQSDWVRIKTLVYNTYRPKGLLIRE